MIGIRFLTKPLDLTPHHVPTWMLVGFICSALLVFGIVLTIINVRIIRGPFPKDKQRFAIHIMILVFVIGTLQDALYAVFHVTSIAQAVPIEIVTYAALIALVVTLDNLTGKAKKH